MKTDEIKKILEDFYNGETNAAEEQALFDYFDSDNIAEELIDEKKVFLELYNTTPVGVPSGLENRLDSLIDKLSAEEEKKVSRNRKQLWIWIGSVAATIALLFSATHYINNRSKEGQGLAIENIKTNEDEKALEEAQKALILLSTNYNKGVSQLSMASASINKTTEILNKTLKQKQ